MQRCRSLCVWQCLLLSASLQHESMRGIRGNSNIFIDAKSKFYPFNSGEDFDSEDSDGEFQE